MIRRVSALAGLLCMLWHAGLVVLHHATPNDRHVAAAASILSVSAPSGLAEALMASMCRPARNSSGSATLPAPSAPAEDNAPCLVCCCPAATAVLAPIPVRCPDPTLEPSPGRVAWHARDILLRERISERPPVRGPPFAA